MMNKSKFEEMRLNHDELKHLVQTRNEKKMDFYLSLGKLTYTALVLGIIVGLVQGGSDLSLLHIVAIVLGSFLTFAWYKIADNYLRK